MVVVKNNSARGVAIDVRRPLEKTSRQVPEHPAVAGIQYDHVPLAVSRIVEQIQDQLGASVAVYVGQWMRADLRPFLAFLDVLFDIPPPLDAQALRFRSRPIVFENVNMALKIPDGHQLHLSVAVHIGQTEPAVGAAGVVAQLRFLAARRAVEDHHAIVGRDADLRAPVAIDIEDDIERHKDVPFRRVGLPYATRPVETPIVSEQLQSADDLIRPGLIPGDSLVSRQAGQDLGPSLVVRFHGRPQRPATVDIQLRRACRHQPRRAGFDSGGRAERNAVLTGHRSSSRRSSRPATEYVHATCGAVIAPWIAERPVSAPSCP